MIFSLFVLAFILIFYGFLESYKIFNKLKVGEYPEKNTLNKLFFPSLTFLNKNLLFVIFIFIFLLVTLYPLLKIYGLKNEIYHNFITYFSFAFISTLFFSTLIFLLPFLLIKINCPLLESENQNFVIKNSLYFFSFFVLSIVLFVYLFFYLIAGTDSDYFSEASFKFSFLWIGSVTALFVLFLSIKLSRVFENIENVQEKTFISFINSFFFKTANIILFLLFLPASFIGFSYIFPHFEKGWIYVFSLPILFIISFIASFIYFDKYKKSLDLPEVFNLSTLVYIFLNILILFLLKTNMWFLISAILGIISFHLNNFVFRKLSLKIENLFLNRFLIYSFYSFFYICMLSFFLNLAYHSGVKALFPFYEVLKSGIIGVNFFIIASLSISIYDLLFIVSEYSIPSLEILKQINNKPNLDINSSFVLPHSSNSHLYLSLLGIGAITCAIFLESKNFQLPLNSGEYFFSILMGTVLFSIIVCLIIFALYSRFKNRFNFDFIPDGYFLPFIFLFSFLILQILFFIVLRKIFTLSFLSIMILLFVFLLFSVLAILLVEIFVSKDTTKDCEKVRFLEDFKDVLFYSTLFMIGFLSVVFL